MDSRGVDLDLTHRINIVIALEFERSFVVYSLCVDPNKNTYIQVSQTRRSLVSFVLFRTGVLRSQGWTHHYSPGQRIPEA